MTDDDATDTLDRMLDAWSEAVCDAHPGHAFAAETRRRAARLDRWRQRASAVVTASALIAAAALYGLAGASELSPLASLQLSDALPGWITWLALGGLVTTLLAAIDAEG